MYGTGYIKLMPEAVTDLYSEVKYTRLVLLNSEYLTIETSKDDAALVTAYIIEYRVLEDEIEVTYRETTALQEDETWLVTMEVSRDRLNDQWDTISSEPWLYTFPPIIHWKNMPTINSIYGSSELDDIAVLQDKYNFVASNIVKMVRLQAHKQLWQRGQFADTTNGTKPLEIGPDKIVKLVGDGAEIGAVDLNTDITGSREFMNDLRRDLYDVMRVVDISTIKDKLGQLTNYSARLLYSDMLTKIQTKRMLFGEMLEELNRRLLVLSGKSGEESRPGEVIWQDPLPTNRVEDVQVDMQLISAGIVSKQAIAEKYGLDWETEQERMAEEKGTGDREVGAAILRAFPGFGA